MNLYLYEFPVYLFACNVHMVSYPSLRSHAGENRAGPPNINTKQQIASLQSAETGPRADPSTVFSLIAEKGFLPIVDSGSIEAICR